MTRQHLAIVLLLMSPTFSFAQQNKFHIGVGMRYGNASFRYDDRSDLTQNSALDYTSPLFAGGIIVLVPLSKNDSMRGTKTLFSFIKTELSGVIRSAAFDGPGGASKLSTQYVELAIILPMVGRIADDIDVVVGLGFNAGLRTEQIVRGPQPHPWLHRGVMFKPGLVEELGFKLGTGSFITLRMMMEFGENYPYTERSLCLIHTIPLKRKMRA